MDLAEVERWVRGNGFSASDFRAIYEESYAVAAFRLIHAAHREQFETPSKIEEYSARSWRIKIGTGATAISVPIKPPFPLGHVELAGLPALRKGETWRELTTAEQFLNALQRGWHLSVMEFDRIARDFNGSLANLILTRALYLSAGQMQSSTIEPAYAGHSIYPYPALREPVPVADAVSFSHVTGQVKPISCLVAKQYEFQSFFYASEHECFNSWAGANKTWIPGLIPLHPWQWNASAPIRAAEAFGYVKWSDVSVNATPLASQRTCRLTETGFDLKLPIDVTITGERRLLYQLHVRNAPAISALIQAVRHAEDDDLSATTDFQYDVAAIRAKDDVIGDHLATIIRKPVSEGAESVVVPALLLWGAPYLAAELFDIGRGTTATQFFSRYCRIVLAGPVCWYARWGLAFEPHLQNSLIKIRGGQPAGLILRDLDATIMDAQHVPPLLKQRQLEVDPRTWQNMSSIEEGARRLRHSIDFMHLGEVCGFLISKCGAVGADLLRELDRTWDDIINQHHGETRKRIVALRSLNIPVMRLLAMRMEQATTMNWLL